MAGKITFHFDDCFITQYEQAFPIFQKAGVPGCLVVAAGEGRHAMTFDQMMEMQNAGWEIICHTFSHIRMAAEPVTEDVAKYEVVQSKQFLEEKGFRVRQFVTPYSACHADTLPMLRAHYDAAFTVYKNSNAQPIEELVIKRPILKYRLNRAVMSGHTLDELKAFVDYVAEHDEWLIFYEHELGAGKNISAEILAAVLQYCKDKDVEILTSSEALDREMCTTDILQEDFDGKECFVHARAVAKDSFRMITAQKMDVTGCDFFECLQVNTSSDGGHTWTGFRPDTAFMPLQRTVRLPATCHHRNPRLMELAREFIQKQDVRGPMLFYLWGHSYEFDYDQPNNNWGVIEEFAEYMGGKDDIWYATNIEIYDYIAAYNQLIFSMSIRLLRQLQRGTFDGRISFRH